MKLMARWLTVVLAGALLAGCWNGKAWFLASEAVDVVPSGQYRLTELRNGEPIRPVGDEEEAAAARKDERITLVRQSDGSISMTGMDGRLRIVIVRIAGRSDWFLMQAQQLGRDADDNAAFLLLDTSEGRLRLASLSCSGPVRAALEAGAGSVARDPNSPTACLFRDRATMLRLLPEALAHDAPRLEIGLERVVR